MNEYGLYMRVGQTSLLYFLGKAAASILGFVATVYFARLLGASTLGIYYLVLSLLTILTLFTEIGVLSAVVKRISEGQEHGQYLLAGLIFSITSIILISLGLIVFQNVVDNYVKYSGASIILILLIFTKLSFSYVGSLLQGQRLIHVYGVLKPVKLGVQTILQISAVVLGFGLLGLFGGYALGSFLIALLGIYYISIEIKMPNRDHFRSLFDYAKYAWLGNVEGKTYRYTDILVLGAFVPSGLVGIYGIAWAISDFLRMFGSAISTTVFPEISKLSIEDQTSSVRSLVSDALTYGGLVLIPGLVGAAILAEPLLQMYGDEFVQGTEVLLLLVLGALFHGYQKQFTSALNGINRPDLSFRVNTVFITVNILMNIILVSQYGWIGAAVATSATATFCCLLAYYYVRKVLAVSFPFDEVGRQVVAALLMGVFVWATAPTIIPQRDTQMFFIAVPTLVGFGAVLYFGVLFTISETFRTTVRQNLPVNWFPA